MSDFEILAKSLFLTLYFTGPRQTLQMLTDYCNPRNTTPILASYRDYTVKSVHTYTIVVNNGQKCDTYSLKRASFIEKLTMLRCSLYAALFAHRLTCTITQSHTHTPQQTQTHKAVTRRIETEIYFLVKGIWAMVYLSQYLCTCKAHFFLLWFSYLSILDSNRNNIHPL